ncbi:MAG: SPFH domain-containing protein [Bacteroidaceae bacterium]
MKANEFEFNGLKLNGFLMLFLNLIVLPLIIAGLCFFLAQYYINLAIAVGLIGFVFTVILLCGFYTVQPNTARVMIFFGAYKGTFKLTGFFWAHPFMEKKKLSLRARNGDLGPIKVNDKIGNPILIGLVLVWKLKDTYKAMFEIDAQTMAMTNNNNDKTSANTQIADTLANRMVAFGNFVEIQGDAALRQVASQYAYDSNEINDSSLTLRDGGDEVNQQLNIEVNKRLEMAGIEIVEARINYLAYAPEIAAVMLRRQQASAIISAREKIVEGAVSMVKLALNKLNDESIIKFDDKQKAAMVSNLLVVLCADESARPVINTDIE